MSRRLARSSALFTTVVNFLRPRRRLRGERPLMQGWEEQEWSRRGAGGAMAILALTALATFVRPAGALGPAMPALVALDPEDLPAGAAFGTSVAAAGRVVVVGAPLLGGGVAYIYTDGPGGWRQSGELRGSDTQAGDFFGGAVAISGATVVVGADDHAGSGRAYVFRQGGQGWRQVAELAGAGDRPGAGFGFSVTAEAGTIVVGAPAPVLGTGTAYVFRQDDQGWGQVAQLQAQGATVGGDFGFSVSASGSVAVVGAPGVMLGAGRAYVFRQGGQGWRQVAELACRGGRAGDKFGFSVAESAGQVLVGAPWDGAGAAYLFSASGRGWRQIVNLRGRGDRPGDKFGSSVALGPGLAVAGAPGYKAGQAYVFSQVSGGWRQTAKLVGPTASGSYFGTATAVSPAAVVIGSSGYRAGAGAVWTALS